MYTGVPLMMVGRGVKIHPPIFFLPKFFFLKLKRGQENTEIFSERLFWWCIAEKMEKPAFYRPQNRTI
jgi:hypothetical protein